MNRRLFIRGAIKFFALLMYPGALMPQANQTNRPKESIKLFLCGDVMTGRGIDQILRHSSKPQLYESYVRDARDYVTIAEQANGPIPAPVAFDYVWGDALEIFERFDPHVRIINLETSITVSDEYWPDKGINYRMHPANIPVLSVAGIDCCVLANNHVLDWGYKGLTETITTLRDAEIETTGAGANLEQAKQPAVIELPGKGRLVVFSYGLDSSGVPEKWAATTARAGVNRLPDLSEGAVARVQRDVQTVKRGRDIVIASIHWGGNWGYAVPGKHRQFAHQLIDDAGVDIIHGHSSHHPMAIEIYRGKPIFYGCGDLLNDYEGIRGYEHYRGDLSLLYFVSVNPSTGELLGLDMVPMQVRRFRLQHAPPEDAAWMQTTMDRECARFGHSVELTETGMLMLKR